MNTFGEYIFKVRSYECGANGRATLPTICNYLQEAASLNAEELGFSKSDFNAAGNDITWVLTKLRVKMMRYPKWEEEVKVLTFPRGGRKIVAWRDFAIYDAAGEVIGLATSEWMIIDLATRRIVSIPENVFTCANTEREPVLGAEPFTRFKYPAKPLGTVPTESLGTVPTSPTDCTEPTASLGTVPLRFRAQNAHIDLNGHVNNVHYIEWMLEATPGTVPSEMEIVFRSETFAGDEVLVEATTGDDVPGNPTGTVPNDSNIQNSNIQAFTTYYRVFAPDGKDHITAFCTCSAQGDLI